ncbi:MAG TPA: histidine--tRNA ligase [Alphaproteobacteria bacterium]|nr:histidine--tRNA ligase [Alphaproteobacteria bacterium]
MSSLQPVRGTHDILPDDSRRQRHVVETARGIAERYGFGEISTPIFEFTEVFARTLGETSDIVTKEMYTFEDRGGDKITLRPEGTAGIARALVSGGLAQDLPLKFFYAGPMFRYERPQKGRLRQFHQFGVELLGIAQPQADIEVIALAAHILESLGALEKTRLEINTLGDRDSREAYRKVLVDYLAAHHAKLSEDSRTRLERNPLRVLDSKDEGDKTVLKDAPLFPDYLTQASRDFFSAVCAGLNNLGVAFVENPRLVRGLDYYCHTAFEFTTDHLGAQGTVLAGGRYDGLVAAMGGRETAGVGWAAGIERLSMLIDDAPLAARPIAVIPAGGGADAQALCLAQELRRAGFAVELGYSGNLAKRMKRANKVHARAAVILGPDEMSRGAVTLRDLDSGEQAEVALSALRDRLTAFR